MIKSKRITNPDSNKCRIANPPQRTENQNGLQILIVISVGLQIRHNGRKIKTDYKS